ncbi:MAG TPA: VWA domain-containing protein [Vicinamibacterales bacterium]|nr:VWA domain-containing protein [Vicinamibacterales bacterium]
MGRLVVAVFVAAGAGAIAVPSSQRAAQPPVFRAGIEGVEVDVVVTTKQGAPVADLSERDFQVLEDGKPQTLTAFTRIQIPIANREQTRNDEPVVEPDVVTNERANDGRVYVVILDDLHLSPRWVVRAKSVAREFIDRLGPNDLMAIVHTAGPTSASQEFTANRTRLRDAADRTTANALESANAVTNHNLQASNGLAGGDTFTLERARNADMTLRIVQHVAQWFQTVRGRRKAILLISEGIDYEMSMVDRPDEPNTPSDMVLNSARAAIDASMRSNVSIYAIDPSGLSGADDIATDYFAPRSSALGPRGAQREHDLAQHNLRWVSEETGGIAVIGRTDLARAYDAIVADNSMYYVLGYTPPPHNNDGKFHAIRVRVNRPGIIIRARSGYVSPKGGAVSPSPSGAEDPLAAPLPIAGATIRLALAPFKGAGSKASVLMTEDIQGRDLALGVPNSLELSYVAVDAGGQAVATSRDRLELTAGDPEVQARIRASGIRVLNRLDLPPGRYTVKAAVHDVAATTSGSVAYDLDVPDFDTVPLAMSGLALTSMTTDRFVVAKDDAPMRAVLPAPPIAERDLPRRSEVWVYAEVYDNLGPIEHTTRITTTLTSASGAIVYHTTSDHDPKEFRGQHGTFRYRVRVPLADAAAGRCVITVEARTTGDRPEIAKRQVPIVVADTMTP